MKLAFFILELTDVVTLVALGRYRLVAGTASRKASAYGPGQTTSAPDKNNAKTLGWMLRAPKVGAY